MEEIQYMARSSGSAPHVTARGEATPRSIIGTPLKSCLAVSLADKNTNIGARLIHCIWYYIRLTLALAFCLHTYLISLLDDVLDPAQLRHRLAVEQVLDRRSAHLGDAVLVDPAHVKHANLPGEEATREERRFPWVERKRGNAALIPK